MDRQEPADRTEPVDGLTNVVKIIRLVSTVKDPTRDDSSALPLSCFPLAAPMTSPKKTRVRETVSLYEAKTNLSALVERAAEGQEIVIAKSGKPKALLGPLDDARPLRRCGRGRGQWVVRADFDSPLPDTVLEEFEGDGA